MENTIVGGLAELIADMDLKPGKVVVLSTPIHGGKTTLLRELWVHMLLNYPKPETTLGFDFISNETRVEAILEQCRDRLEPYMGFVVDNKRMSIADASNYEVPAIYKYLKEGRHIQPGSFVFIDNLHNIQGCHGEILAITELLHQMAEELQISIVVTANLQMTRDFFMTYRDFRRGHVPTNEQLELFKETADRMRRHGQLYAEHVYFGAINAPFSVKESAASFSLVDCSRPSTKELKTLQIAIA